MSDQTITLRDQLAMAAMQGDLAAQDKDAFGIFASDIPIKDLQYRALFYYRMADAMLLAKGACKGGAA